MDDKTVVVITILGFFGLLAFFAYLKSTSVPTVTLGQETLISRDEVRRIRYELRGGST